MLQRMFSSTNGGERVAFVGYWAKSRVESTASYICLEAVNINVCLEIAKQDCLWLYSDSIAV